MALDFKNLENQEQLYSLDDKTYSNLDDIFSEYKHWTGIYIDPYGNTPLTVENQRLLVKIIDKYIDKTDLNEDKQKTVDILQFRGLMTYFLAKNIDIKIVGD